MKFLEILKNLFFPKSLKVYCDYEGLQEDFAEVKSVDGFEDIVAKALEAFPEEFQEEIQKVPTIIEDFPTKELILRLKTIPFAMYQGVSLPRKTPWTIQYQPDRVVLFRKIIEKECESKTREEAERWITQLVRHEYGHHFGFDDEELLKWEL